MNSGNQVGDGSTVQRNSPVLLPNSENTFDFHITTVIGHEFGAFYYGGLLLKINHVKHVRMEDMDSNAHSQTMKLIQKKKRILARLKIVQLVEILILIQVYPRWKFLWI
jgi:hypothetical protein